MNTLELSIVVPIYNEEENLDYLFQRLFKVLDNLHTTYEIICINDGSKDKSLDFLIQYSKDYPVIKVINLSRNFGKDIALSAGIDLANGNAVIPIDADLQDPPELIGEMVDLWKQGYDVVYASRRIRQGETWFKKFTAEGFYKVINGLSKISIPHNTGDFRLIDRCVVEAIKRMPEKQRFMKGLFAWVGFKQTAIYFDREPRYQGQTKWNYWKLWNFALDGITSFSFLPLKIWGYVGLIISCLSLIYALYLVIRTLIFGIDVPGYASLMVAILFLGGIQLLTLGIIGEYLGRVYEEVKDRPLYLVRDLYGFDKSGTGYNQEK
ncbi:MAG: putative glycosyltransferase [Chroococcopsis gigantea SAG 12.99]|nr:glycosyltransferase family 2 protein [Chlorogloea purpurea SAG 13.99]MDV3001806.1 putative glycosyltransferase [Chroococcopsis gigantea SAG 12.99]